MCFLSELLGQLYIGDTQYQKYPCLNQNIVHSKAMTIYIWERFNLYIFCAALLYPLYRPLSPWVSIVWCHSLRLWRNRIIPQTRPTVKIFIFRVKCTCTVHFSSSSLSHCGTLCVCVCSLFLSLFFLFWQKILYPKTPTMKEECWQTAIKY